MIKKETTVYQEDPFAYVLHRIHSKSRCDSCLKRCKLQMCENCLHVGYCSDLCQKKDEFVHLAECHLIKNVNGEFLDDVRLVARIITKIKNRGSSEKIYYTEKDYRTFYDLESHKENVLKDNQRMEEFDELYTDLVKFMGKKKVPDKDEVFEIFLRLIINSYCINAGPFDSIGTGLYLAISVLDHSCSPNLIYVHVGPKMIVTAVKDIPDCNWKKMTIPYVIISERTKERKQLLMANYYFDCNCQKCKDPDWEAACPNQFCQSSCQPDATKCSICCTKIPQNLNEIYDRVLERSEELVNTRDIADYSTVKVCLEMQKGVLHDANSMRLKVLKIAYDFAKQNCLWQEAEKYLQKLILGYSKHYTLLNLSYILMHLDLARIYYEQEKFDDCSSVLQKVKDPLHTIFAEHVTDFLHEVNNLFPREILTMLR